MKILCEYADCGPSYVRTGWGRVFAAMGHEFVFWRPGVKPALDIFAEFEPDLFLGTTYGLDRAVFNALAARPSVRVAMYCSAWGKLAQEIPEEYPITRASLQEKRNVEALRKLTGRPDFVFSHVGDRYLDSLLGGWRDAGVEPAGLLNAADTFAYLGGTPREEFAADVSFVGGWWDYKARNLGPYLLPLCRPDLGLRVKIFGNQPWPVAQYLGPLDESDAKDVFASAAVCPNVSEPHSTSYNYDVVERPFKVLAAGGFCVSDYVQGMRDIFTENEVPMADSPDRFREMVMWYISHPEECDKHMRAGRRLVLESHTYFHRVSQMLTLLGMSAESERCLALHRDLIGNSL